MNQIFQEDEIYLVQEDKFYQKNQEVNFSNLLFNFYFYLFMDDFKLEGDLKNKLINLDKKVFYNPAILKNGILRKSFDKLENRLGFKIPIREKIQKEDLREIFLNFPQPSFIFNKDYKKIKKVQVFNDLVGLEGDEFYVEEKLDGEVYYFFYIKGIRKNREEKVFWVKRDKNKKLVHTGEDLEIIEKIRKTANDLELSFGLFKLLKNKKRGWYILNLEVKDEILVDQRVKEILENYQLEIKELI